MQRMKIPHDATLNIPGLEKHGRRQGPSLLSPSATGTREHHQHPSLQIEGPEHLHRPSVYRIGSSPSAQTTRQAGRGGSQHPQSALPGSFACHPASPQVRRDLGLWHQPSPALLHPTPNFPSMVGLPSCSEDWGIPVEHLSSQALGMCSVLCLLPLPLPGSSLLPPNQAVGSSSGSWGSPPPPPPSRALRFFDISAQGLGFGSFSFPSPWALPSRRE